MNIEIANRLVELRKKNGLSQEELAMKLGLSRQAVSKWERAESSPDTDNLICLAKLYNVSLDDLLKTDDDPFEDIKNEGKLDKEKIVHVGASGIYVKKDKKEVSVGLSGIHIKKADGDEIHLGSRNFEFSDTIATASYKSFLKRKRICDIIGSIIWALGIILYIAMGAIYNTWHPDWLIFIDLLIISSILDTIKYKSPLRFNISFLALAIYLYLGFYLNLWHPGWVVFLAIPLYYILVPKGSWEIYSISRDGATYKDFRKKDKPVEEKWYPTCRL